MCGTLMLLQCPLLVSGLMCAVQDPHGPGNMTASAWLTGSDQADSIFDDATGKVNNASHSRASSGDDVSTERRPGTFTNQQVPKNLTGSESSTENSYLQTGNFTKSAEEAGSVAASGLTDALPANLLVESEDIGSNMSAALKNASVNLTTLLQSTSESGPFRQQLERVLQDRDQLERALQDRPKKGMVDMHGNSDTIGVGQYNSSSKRLLESTRMSQLFGVFGAVLVFALWMLRRRRKPHHSHNAPGLLGPGVDQGIGGWLRPRSGRHRLATA